MEKMRQRSKNSRNKVYVNIARIKVTIPGAVDEKLYEKLQIAVIPKKENKRGVWKNGQIQTEVTVGVTKEMELEEIARRILICSEGR